MKKMFIIFCFLLSFSQQVHASSCQATMGKLLSANTSMQKDLGEYPVWFTLESHLWQRQRAGELNEQSVREFMQTSMQVEQLGEPAFFGAGAVQCLKEFSTLAVENFMALVRGVKGLENKQGLFPRLMKSSRKLFGDNEIRAKKRICFLSGKGEKCQVFGASVAKNCR